MRGTILVWLSVALVVGGVGVAQSVEEPAVLEDSAAGIDRAADRAVAQRLARPLGMEASTLETQRAQTLLGWGDLVIANRLAQATGFSFTQIVKESQSGKSWEAIAEDHGADRSKLTTDAKRARAALEAPDKPLDAPRDSSADQSPRPGSTGRSGGPSHRRGGFGIPGFGGSGTNQ
jgi:hypothetical protein